MDKEPVFGYGDLHQSLNYQYFSGSYPIFHSQGFARVSFLVYLLMINMIHPSLSQNIKDFLHNQKKYPNWKLVNHLYLWYSAKLNTNTVNHVNTERCC